MAILLRDPVDETNMAAPEQNNRHVRGSKPCLAICRQQLSPAERDSACVKTAHRVFRKVKGKRTARVVGSVVFGEQYIRSIDLMQNSAGYLNIEEVGTKPIVSTFGKARLKPSLKAK